MHKLIIVVLILIIVWLLFKPHYENFNSDQTEFIPVGPVGSIRYGLRGEPLIQESIAKFYYPDARQIRLNQTGNWMYQSKVPINQEPGFGSCTKTQCPRVNGYDCQDTCWTCPSNSPNTPFVGEIWPRT